jgi:hypothetical protein
MPATSDGGNDMLDSRPFLRSCIGPKNGASRGLDVARARKAKKAKRVYLLQVMNTGE